MDSKILKEVIDEQFLNPLDDKGSKVGYYYLLSKCSLGQLVKNQKYEIVEATFQGYKNNSYLKIVKLQLGKKTPSTFKIIVKARDVKNLFFTKAELRTDKLKELLASLD